MTIEIIPIKKKGFVKPTKQNYSDAGFDVVATSREWTEDYIEYGLGFTSELPHNVKGVIVPRSSISKYDLVMCNSPAQIDPGYKGEWKVRFYHTGHVQQMTTYTSSENGDLIAVSNNMILDDTKVYNVGDRIAQIYFEKIQDLDIVGVVEGESTRDGGFGSTGN